MCLHTQEHTPSPHIYTHTHTTHRNHAGVAVPWTEDMQTAMQLWDRSCGAACNCGQLWQATRPLSVTVFCQTVAGGVQHNPLALGQAGNLGRASSNPPRYVSGFLVLSASVCLRGAWELGGGIRTSA